MNPVNMYQLILLAQEDRLREAAQHRRLREARALRGAQRSSLGRLLRRILMPRPTLKLAQHEQA